MSVNADCYAEEHKTPLGERVGVEEPRGGGGEDPDADQLPGVEVLRHPAHGVVVFVVESVHVAVEEPHLVVD